MANDAPRRRTSAVLAIAGALLAIAPLSSCSSAPGAADPEPTASRPDGVSECGEFDGGNSSEMPDSMYACLESGVSTGARATLTSVTDEGDPIVSHYRVGPGIDGVEAFFDTTQDKFGRQGWYAVHCPELSILVTPELYSRCTTEDLDEAPAL